jgi:hypothetical protein
MTTQPLATDHRMLCVSAREGLDMPNGQARGPCGIVGIPTP